jgi:hypothetical protein
MELHTAGVAASCCQRTLLHAIQGALLNFCYSWPPTCSQSDASEHNELQHLCPYLVLREEGVEVTKAIKSAPQPAWMQRWKDCTSTE